MVKSIHGRAYSDNENNVFIKSILGVKTKFMKSYIMPTVELELEVIVIHRSTKNLKQIMTPEAIPCETVVMGTSPRSISGIITRKDRSSVKAGDANEYLKMLSSSRNIPFVDYSNIYVTAHVNYGGSHLKFWEFKISD